MPASASASTATPTTRLSTVSVSNLPNGVCAHPTMLAVMVFSFFLGGVVTYRRGYFTPGSGIFLVARTQGVFPARWPVLSSPPGLSHAPPPPITFGPPHPPPHAPPP